MPFWLSALVSLAVQVIAQWIANREANAALRDLGARTQAEESRRAAEKQEAEAAEAARRAGSSPEDPADPFRRD